MCLLQTGTFPLPGLQKYLKRPCKVCSTHTFCAFCGAGLHSNGRDPTIGMLLMNIILRYIDNEIYIIQAYNIYLIIFYNYSTEFKM